MKRGKYSVYSILVAAVVMFAACDKISPDAYTIFDGAVISWVAGEPLEAATQRALVEKFTGPKCTNCPMADRTLEAAHHQLGERLVLISINHSHDQGEPYPGQPDIRTEGGNAWAAYYGISGIPDAYINRNTGVHYQGSMENIVADIRTALEAAPVVALDVKATAGQTIDVNIGLQFVEDYTSETTLTVALLEDSLVYLQAMPMGSPVPRDSNYVHNHMLRQVITSPWGSDISATGKAGECLKGSLSFKPSTDVVMKNCHIVAFVSDKASRKVLNSASCKVEVGE